MRTPPMNGRFPSSLPTDQAGPSFGPAGSSSGSGISKFSNGVGMPAGLAKQIFGKVPPGAMPMSGPAVELRRQVQQQGTPAGGPTPGGMPPGKPPMGGGMPPGMPGKPPM